MARRPPQHRACAWLVGILLLGFVARDASAQTYSVEIRPTLNDLDVKIEQIPQRSQLTIRLTNNESTRVRCVLNFDASPQTPRRSTRSISAHAEPPGNPRLGTAIRVRAAALVTHDTALAQVAGLRVLGPR